MTTDTYLHLRHVYKERLLAYFPQNKLNSLVEAPDKNDHGDIDFVIASNDQIDFFALAKHLGAQGLICHSSYKCSLRVPMDGSRHDGPVILYKDVHGDKELGHKLTETTYISDSSSSHEEDQEEMLEMHPSNPLESIQSCNDPRDTEKIHTERLYAQIDFDVVPTDLYAWHIFYASYGDMASLLGHIVHNLGFTVSDKGIWLRFLEYDTSKSVPYHNIPTKDGMLKLSHDPLEVIKFLGLGVEEYQHGFRTLEELYTWLGKCRMLHAKAIKPKRSNARESKRKAKRTVYSGFCNEWLPNHLGQQDPRILEHKSPSEYEEIPSSVVPSSGHLASELIELRIQYAQEAITYFHRQSEYERMHKKLVRKLDSATSVQLLKPLIAVHSGKRNKNLNEIVRAFRRFVSVESIDDEVRVHILQIPHADDESELWQLLEEKHGEKVLRDEINISVFIAENWQHLRDLYRQKAKLTR